MSNILISGRFVVCAAVRAGNTVIAGARHFDSVMRPLVIDHTERLEGERGYKVKWEQGFIDQDGVFMDRKEALLVAHHAGQLDTRRRKTEPLDQLFSEDLY